MKLAHPAKNRDATSDMCLRKRRDVIGNRHVQTGRIAGVTTRDRLQQDSTILGAARERARAIERKGARETTGARHAAVGWLHAEQPVHRCRKSYRASGIRADRAKDDACADRRARTARRASRYPVRIPTVAAIAKVRIPSGWASNHFIHVQRADGDSTRGLQRLQDAGVTQSRQLPRHDGPNRHRLAGALEAILVRQRNPVQRPAVVPLGKLMIPRASRLQGLLLMDGNEGVDHGLQGLRARNGKPGQTLAACPTRAQHRGDLQDRQLEQFPVVFAPGQWARVPRGPACFGCVCFGCVCIGCVRIGNQHGRNILRMLPKFNAPVRTAPHGVVQSQHLGCDLTRLSPRFNPVQSPRREFDERADALLIRLRISLARIHRVLIHPTPLFRPRERSGLAGIVCDYCK